MHLMQQGGQACDCCRRGAQEGQRAIFANIGARPGGSVGHGDCQAIRRQPGYQPVILRCSTAVMQHLLQKELCSAPLLRARTDLFVCKIVPYAPKLHASQERSNLEKGMAVSAPAAQLVRILTPKYAGAPPDSSGEGAHQER